MRGGRGICFVFLGMAWGFICVAGAIVFFLLTLTFKRLQERQELKDNPPPPEGDFITGRVPTDGDRDGNDDSDNE